MNELKSELERVVKVVFGEDVEVEVNVANGQKFSDGRSVDFATNVAMKLAKKLGRNPREIAGEILQGMELDGFEGEVAGPGFLNFIASDEYYLRKIRGFADDFEGNIACDEYAGKTVVCEFSDPNPFKVLHVGHLYTSIVGDAIARLFEYAGARVVRANFGGDVGMHVAKTLYALSVLNSGGEGDGDDDVVSDRGNDWVSGVLEGKTPSETAEILAENYVKGTRAYEEDETAREEITRLNREIYRINAEDLHDTEIAKAYWIGREKSYEYFKEFYARLGVEFDKYYPESAVAELGVETVRKHPKVYTNSDGAVVFRGEEYGLHTRVFINREGLPTYETKDVGLLFTKWKDFEFDKSVVITGSEQKDYMAVVLKSVEMYAPELVERTRHLTHGMVKLPGNEKMSSRLGNFLRAVDVIEMVGAELGGEGRNGDEGYVRGGENDGNDGGEGSGAKMKLTMAALKYAFLRYKMGGDIEFDVKSSVAVTGNSGVYLEYATVRAKRILEKIETLEGGMINGGGRELVAEEKALMKKICEYRGVLFEAVEEMAPHKVCAYLYELAQVFSRFYENVQVVGSEYEMERGRLVGVYLKILEHGLGMLGIKTVEEM